MAVGTRPPRSDIRRWEKSVFQRSRKRAGGRIVTDKDWRIQFQYQGQRKEFNLHSANKSVAARLAREIDQHLLVNGLKATIAKYESSGTPQDERRHKRLALLAEELSKRPAKGSLPKRFWEIVRGIGCTACGFNKWPAILQFHHLDADRQNNALHNLTILCPNCHRAIHQQIAAISPPSLKELLPVEIESAPRIPVPYRTPVAAVWTFKTTTEDLISRPDLSRRWNCHPETLKRKERKGLLHPVYLSTRMIRYKMSEILALENEAAKGPQADTHIPGRFVSTSVATPTPASTPAPGAKRRRRGVPMKKGRSKAKGIQIELHETELER